MHGLNAHPRQAVVATGPARDQLVALDVIWTPEDAVELQRQLAEISERDRLRGS